MALPFTKPELDFLIATLAGMDEVLTPQDQRRFLRQAFYGSPREQAIVTRVAMSNTPRSFAIGLVDFVGHTIQEDVPGRKTASVVIAEMLNLIGEEETAVRLRDIHARYYTVAHAAMASPENPAVEPVRTMEQLAALAPEQRAEVNAVLWAVTQSELSSSEPQLVSRESAQEIQAWAARVLVETHSLNVQLREQVQALANAQHEPSHYLQVSLPILPGLLSYNVELGPQQLAGLKNLWDRIRTRLRPAAKGDKQPDWRATVTHEVLNSGLARGVFVGVSSYDSAVYRPLTYTSDDARALRALLAPGYAGAVLLADAAQDRRFRAPDFEPTRGNIITALQTQADQCEAGDLLLFAFSGHGEVVDDESVLLGRDAAANNLADTSVHVNTVLKIMNGSPARAKVLILDACHSGVSLGKSSPFKRDAEFNQRAFAQSEGVATLASCRQHQQSYEAPEYKKGAYTHFLLKALRGEADLRGSGFVTVSDAHQYVNGMVKMWAARIPVAQNPTLEYKVDGDIILNHYARRLSA